MPKADKKPKNQGQPSLIPIFVVIAGFIIVCIGIIMLATSRGAGRIPFKPETPRQVYLSILSEAHTGLRLARLQDFAENYVRNDDTLRSRTARDALTKHEQDDWAKLTRVLYDLKSTETQSADALATYRQHWGIWNRQEDLPTLLQATGIGIISSSDMLYAPNARRSKFSRGSGSTLLAGEIPVDVIPDEGLEQSTPNRFNVQNARMLIAKRPKYPRRARRKNIEAVVTLALFIDERGNVARTELVSVDAEKYRSSFTRASKKAAMSSKFYPKTVGGKPVASSGYLRKYIFATESDES